jgi:hypothetical protein
MRFSQRKGLSPVAKAIQTEGMSEELRNSLWNALDQFLWQSKGFLHVEYGQGQIYNFSHELWFHFFKLPADQRPEYPSKILKAIRDFFFGHEWYEIYDFLEWVVSYLDQAGSKYEEIFNIILERELSGYRFVDGKLVDITDKQEIAMLEQAIDDSKFSGASAHLKRALDLLADRKAPDYRNSIKESISAVESVARQISESPKATLGEALKVLEKRGKIHPALKDGFLKLYGYTSDEQGIRHAMLDESKVTQADARFMLLSCTSFVNYLKAQL